MIALATFSVASAQSTEELSSLYQKYGSTKGAFAMSLNKEMMDVVDVDLDWNDQMKHVSGDIYEVKFIVFTNEESVDNEKAIKEINRSLQKMNLVEIPLEADDSDIKYLKVYGLKKKGFYRKVHFLMYSDDNAVFFSVLGKLKVKKADL